ncbi:MAG: hypothetical protein WDO56_24530 [Gammaproteobacteria bacterium]
MMLPFDVRRDVFRWSWCLMFAGLAHAAVLVGLLVDIRFGTPDPAMAAMVVEMAPTPVSIVTPPTEIPPGPPQVESRPVARPKVARQKLPFDPPPEVKMETPPEVLVQKEPEEVPDELLAKEKPVDITTAAPTAVAPPGRQAGRSARWGLEHGHVDAGADLGEPAARHDGTQQTLPRALRSSGARKTSSTCVSRSIATARCSISRSSAVAATSFSIAKSWPCSSVPRLCLRHPRRWRANASR